MSFLRASKCCRKNGSFDLTGVWMKQTYLELKIVQTLSFQLSKERHLNWSWNIAFRIAAQCARFSRFENTVWISWKLLSQYTKAHSKICPSFVGCYGNNPVPAGANGIACCLSQNRAISLLSSVCPDLCCHFCETG